MCRILVIANRPRVDDKYVEFINAFIKASKNDVYLEKISRSGRKSHSDGWGLAGIGLVDVHPVILYYKTILPIYHSVSREILNLFNTRIKHYNELFLVLHVRLSSIKEPYGEKYVHPFEVKISKRGILWFIHNGEVDKTTLYREAGVESPYYYTDSWIAALYLAKYMEKCIARVDDVENCVVEAYNKLLEYVVTALNTGLLVFYDNQPFLYASFYHREYNKLEHERKIYYQLRMYRETETSVIASSTIDYYIGGMEEAEQGLYRVLPGKIIKIANFT